MRKRNWGRRGKPSNANAKILEYLARIAVKYKVDSSEFFNRIVEASNQEKSKCKPLIIRCRKKTEDSAVYLFTSAERVVAQFPIPTEVFQGKQRYMRMVSARALSVKNFQVLNPQIRDLKPGMKRVNLKARVLDIPRPNMVYTRWGTEAYVSNALITDDTGTIRMSLWNQQINIVSKGDIVKIENGRVASFKGERQLRVGRHGRISVAGDESIASNIEMTNSDEKKLQDIWVRK